MKKENCNTDEIPPLTGGVKLGTANRNGQEEERTRNKLRVVFRVSIISIAVNVLLTAFKFFAGIFAHSMAMISDAVHSASDVFSTVLVMIGAKIASKGSDENHQYGHERYECVAAILLAVTLAATGAVLGLNGVKTLLKGNYSDLTMPGTVALVAAAVSIAVKESMFWVTRAAAKKVNSGSLKADAWHHRSDALSSIGALAGIIGAKLGAPVLDPVASLVICVFIFKAAFDIFFDAVRKMTDEACDTKTVDRLNAIISSQEGVDNVDKLLTRKFGDRIYVETEISVNGDLNLRDAHEIAVRVHNSIEVGCPEVKHVTVHVNPTKNGDDAGTGTEE